MAHQKMTLILLTECNFQFLCLKNCLQRFAPKLYSYVFSSVKTLDFLTASPGCIILRSICQGAVSCFCYYF